MGKKRKQSKVFLDAPDGVKIHRHHIGGESQEIRFTVSSEGFEKLVAVHRNGSFSWVHKNFQK